MDSPASLLLRHVRVVPFRSRGELARLRAGGTAAARGPAPDPVDVLVEHGRVVRLAPHLDARDAEVLDVEGSFVVPGLWDAHAHLDLEAARRSRLDTTATMCAEDALEMVAEAVAATGRDGRPATIQGFGHRLSNWPRVPTVAELDAVTAGVPTVLISGDVHSGWLNSAALEVLGLPGATSDDPGEPMREDPWFAVLDRLDEIPGSRELRESGYTAVLDDALARGVTGVVDMTFGAEPEDWPRRVAAAARTGHGPRALPRIRTAVYRDGLQRWIGAGLRTGSALPGSPTGGDGQPLFTQGPLKIISDGSMGTASAHVHDAYPPGIGSNHGISNIEREDLVELLRYADAMGYEVAVHAIGDAAVEDAAHALKAAGAKGRMEHVQLLPRGAEGPDGVLATLVSCGIELSVQPAHLLDDWDFVERVWPGARERTYAFADMVRAGALLHLGSDAPVAPLDPWLAMSVAVDRRMRDGRLWSPSQRLTTEEALASSVDGAPPVGVGSRADLVVLDEDPLTLDAEELAKVRPATTVAAGMLVRNT